MLFFRPRPALKGLLLLFAVVVTFSLLAFQVPSSVLVSPASSRLAAGTAKTDDSSAPQGIRMVQANIRAGMSSAKTNADLAKVFAVTPDFVTFNEMAKRSDEQLAPPGYALHRTPGVYTGASVVVWNISRWSKLDAGTYMISDRRGKPASQGIHLGIRYANWVTLRGVDGRTMSVISTHFAPTTKYTKDLRIPSYQRLGALAKKLGTKGPVLMGGDLNVQYNGRSYPRSVIEGLGLTATYDQTRIVPRTYSNGGTIDYIYMYRAPALKVSAQRTTALYSDHEMLTADFGEVVVPKPLFVREQTMSSRSNLPGHGVRTVTKALDNAPKGAVAHIMSRTFLCPTIERAIQRAVARGVEVQFLTGHSKAQAVDRRMVRLLGSNTANKSWAKRQDRWTHFQLPASAALVSVSGNVPALRIHMSRSLVPAAQKVPTRVIVAMDKAGYDNLFLRKLKAVGGKL